MINVIKIKKIESNQWFNTECYKNILRINFEILFYNSTFVYLFRKIIIK